MKNIILLLAILTLAFLGYNQWKKNAVTVPEPNTDTRPASTPEAQNVPADTAALPNETGPGVAIQSAETPHHPKPAPEGTYFLRRYLSVTTDSGIFGKAPGTKVTLINRDGAIMHVSDGVNQFDVSEADVTNDMDMAATLSANDRSRQNGLQSTLSEQAKIQQIKETTQLKQDAAQVAAAAQQAPVPQQQQAPQATLLQTTYNKKHAIPILSPSGKIIGYNWVNE